MELPDEAYDWDQSIYDDVQKEIPNDTPTLLGKFVVTTHYMDANLYHDMMTGRSVTGIIAPHKQNSSGLAFEEVSNSIDGCIQIGICSRQDMYRIYHGYKDYHQLSRGTT